MSAEVPIRVKVLRAVEDTVDVLAVTLKGATVIALSMPGVVDVISAEYVDESPKETES